MDLIDKKPLLVSLVDWQMGQFAVVGHEREYNLLDSIIKGIENVPTVEAKEVVHGEWIEVKPRGYTHYSKGYAECSSCNEIVWSGWEMNFCPHCGADMRTSAE